MLAEQAGKNAGRPLHTHTFLEDSNEFSFLMTCLSKLLDRISRT